MKWLAQTSWMSIKRTIQGTQRMRPSLFEDVTRKPPSHVKRKFALGRMRSHANEYNRPGAVVRSWAVARTTPIQRSTAKRSHSDEPAPR